MRIRQMVQKDLEALRDLYFRARIDSFTWLNHSHYALDDFDKDTEGELVLVLEINRTIRGFISLYLPASFIHCFYIDIPYQRQGYGRLLLSTAKMYLRQPMQLKCLSRNAAALAFYKKEGWHKIEQIIVDGPQDHWLLESA